MADLVTAVNSRGEKQDIPPHWLELSEAGVHGFNFRLPPSARAKETKPASKAADAAKEEQ